MFCNFIKIKESVYECSKCGNIVTVGDSIDSPPIFPCFSVLNNYSAKNIKTFMENHKDPNMLCDEEEIENRHNICISCPSFTDNTCSECGCKLARDRNYLNKLAIKDARCPLNKW